MIKKILPFERIIFQSDLQSQDLMARLRDAILRKEYNGRTIQNEFKIKRIISYRNSFLPIIKGEVKDDFQGSKIQVTMELIGFVKVFMGLWLSIVLLFFFMTVHEMLFVESQELDATALLIPLGMAIAGILLTVLSFKFESRKSIKDLEIILQAKRI